MVGSAYNGDRVSVVKDEESWKRMVVMATCALEDD
jgi:hypothetical protein